VYFREMGDYLTPTKTGTMSTKVYQQGDCEMFRSKILSYFHYKESMGKGTPDQSNPQETTWKYPVPDSVGEVILKVVGDSVKTK